MKQLKIFLVSRTDIDNIGTDEYDSFVVITTDEYRARELNPRDYAVTVYKKQGEVLYHDEIPLNLWVLDGCWTDKQTNIKTELLGTAQRHETAERIVCASFNAG